MRSLRLFGAMAMVASCLLDKDVALHLTEVKACKRGMVELRYEVRRHRGE